MAKGKPSTLLVFVQDETGSMMDGRDATVSAFNEYFETLKRDSKGAGKAAAPAASDFGGISVAVWQFSESPGEDRVRLAHDGPLADVPELGEASYRPRGITPLLDAVGTALQQAAGRVADRYLFVVQTDGIENASKDFSHEQVAGMVAEKEAADNWTVVFLGAGVSEWTRAVVAMGATGPSGVAYAATPAATTDTYASLARRSSQLLASNSASDKRLAAKVQADLDSSKCKHENASENAFGWGCPDCGLSASY